MDNDFATGYALGQDSGGSNNGSFFGGEGLWAIIIFAMIFGYGGGGFGFGGGGGGYLNGVITRSDMCQEFGMNDIKNGIRGIQQGLCDGFYAANTGMMQGFHGVDSALCNLGYQITNGQHQLSSQLADCCCQNREAISQVRYDMATNTCAIQNTIQNTTRDVIDSQQAGTRAILDFLTTEKINSLQAENQTLKFQASQSAQNSYLSALSDAQTAELIRRINPTPVPAYQVPAPYPYAANGCGCGC